MKTLSFNVTIQAPRSVVWHKMLDDEGYKRWTSPFCEGSHFVGSWSEGSKILLLAPNGDGMTSIIAKNKPMELISIQHLGEVNNGVEDTTSAKVKAWAPAFESFAFSDSDNGCLVTVSVDTLPEYEQNMLNTYPKALNVLKEMCEDDSRRRSQLGPGVR